MRIKYTKTEMIDAMNEADDELVVELAGEQTTLELNKALGYTKAEYADLGFRNKLTAKEHGVEVADLINSPSYSDLMDASEYRQADKVVKFFMSKGLTEVQATGLLCHAAGLLD